MECWDLIAFLWQPEVYDVITKIFLQDPFPQADPDRKNISRKNISRKYSMVYYQQSRGEELLVLPDHFLTAIYIDLLFLFQISYTTFE